MVKRKVVNINCNDRINFVTIGFFAIALIFIFKLFIIQVIQHEKYVALAQDQHWETQDLGAKRGNIYSSDGYPLATTQISYLLYVEPKYIEDKADVAFKLGTKLAEFNIFEVKNPQEYYVNKLLEQLNLDLYWVRVQSALSPDQKKQIEELNLKGVGFEEEPKRYYPEKYLASHILGFVAKNDKGIDTGYFGIEGNFDRDLKGKQGRIIQEIDALGAPILVGGYKKIDPIQGSDIILTIDRSIQHIVEKRLKEGVLKYGAVSGSVIVMNPMTGDILAMANYPTYDPANFNDLEISSNTNANKNEDSEDSEDTSINSIEKKVERRNAAISDTYEPGSVMKPLTVSAAIDLGLVTPDTTFVDAGPTQYSDYVIDNWDGRHHGVQTITQLLQKSNNIGAAWVGHQVGNENMFKYLQDFGIGTKTGIELEGEDSGLIRDVSIWTDIDLATISFGQGMSATPLQVLNVFNSFANGGNLIRPRIVSSIITDNKEVEIPVTIQKRVISEDTADTMVILLTDAVSGGEAKFFNLKHYDIAGKTGTAQIPVEGKYDPNKTNATFVGFPTRSKKYSMIVKLQEPKESIYAAETAVPLWMQISDDLVKYFGLPPDKYPVEAPTFVESTSIDTPVNQDLNSDLSLDEQVNAL